jgi:NADH-quinone oxidoreductase subunit J
VEVVIFTLAAVGAVAGGVGIIASRSPVRSALSLLLVLGCIAALSLLLAAQFIAALQIIIYAGAIVILFLFVVMLLAARSGETAPNRLGWLTPAGIVLGGVLLAALLATVWARDGGGGIAPIGAEFGTAEAVGQTLFTTFMLPFEAASVLLLVGIIAAVIIGRPEPASPPATETPRRVVEASRR